MMVMGGAQEVEIDRRSEPTGAGKERLLDGGGKKEKKAVAVISITKCFRAISS
jgi:hypothetical protein